MCKAIDVLSNKTRSLIFCSIAGFLGMFPFYCLAQMPWPYQDYDLTPKYRTTEEKRAEQEEASKSDNALIRYQHQASDGAIYQNEDIFTEVNSFVRKTNSSRRNNPLYLSMLEGTTVSDSSVGMNFSSMRMEFENIAYDIDGKINFDGFRQTLQARLDKPISEQLGLSLSNTAFIDGRQNAAMGLKFSF